MRWWVGGLSCGPGICVSASELGMVLAPLNRFKPSSESILLTVQRLCFFCGSFLFVMLHVSVCCDVASVPCSLVVTCWERVDLLAVMFVVVFCHFPKCVWSTSELRARLAP